MSALRLLIALPFLLLGLILLVACILVFSFAFWWWSPEVDFGKPDKKLLVLKK